MEFTYLFSQFLSGLTYGMILFFVASGLSLIFGVMNILNFAHATLWLIGAYFCYSFWSVLQDHGFALWVSIPLAALATAAVGWVAEMLLIKRIYKRELHEQLLITYALALIFGDLIKIVWGPTDRLIVRPPIIQKPISYFGAPLDSYFIFVILVGFAVAIRSLVVPQIHEVRPHREGGRLQPGDGGRPRHTHPQDLSRGFSRWGFSSRASQGASSRPSAPLPWGWTSPSSSRLSA